jgi:hypothetical protein
MKRRSNPIKKTKGNSPYHTNGPEGGKKIPYKYRSNANAGNNENRKDK